MRDGTGNGQTPLSNQAHGQLIELLRSGRLASGQFVSMPGLVELLGYPLAATREAVKRADAHGLVSILPKRGVLVMSAGQEATRHCLDMRRLLDQEGARRLIASDAAAARVEPLRESHVAVLDAARHDMTPDLPARAIVTDLSLHDALSEGLDNPLLAEAYAVNRDRIAVIQNTRPFLPDRIASAMEEHLAIIDALEAGDAEAATGTIAAHHRATLRWWGVQT